MRRIGVGFTQMYQRAVPDDVRAYSFHGPPQTMCRSRLAIITQHETKFGLPRIARAWQKTTAT